MNVFGDEAAQQRRSARQREATSPSIVAADKEIGDRGKEKTEIVTRVHQRRAHRAALLGPVFGNQGSPHRPFSANSHTSHESKNRQAPYTRGKRGQHREQ